LLKEYESRLEQSATLPKDAITINAKITNRQVKGEGLELELDWISAPSFTVCFPPSSG